jgi:hypothetical protein
METPRLPQLTTRAFLKPNRAGGETLNFTIHLLHFHLVCIVNIPAEGETEAPVYIKFKVEDARRFGSFD